MSQACFSLSIGNNSFSFLEARTIFALESFQVSIEKKENCFTDMIDVRRIEVKEKKKKIKNTRTPCNFLYFKIHAINKTTANAIKQNTDHVLSKARTPLKGNGNLIGIEVKGNNNIPKKKMPSIALSILQFVEILLFIDISI
ncbi:MAG: hypothetical protein SPD11_00715 [Sphaerochaetaceae bacterium]|nr:hypothetical protein [Sphaerochaetaceae bacterium]